jgi:rod shape-determining protein MreC
MLMQFFKQYRVLLISLILVLAGLHLISSSIDDPENAGFFARMVYTIYEPIYKVTSLPFQKAGSAMSNLSSIATLREQNAKLAQQNKALQKQVNEYSELAQAAERYRLLLSLKETTPDLISYARIIARPSTQEYRVVVVDKGEKDGVTLNTAVVTPKGLVGHVVATAPYASKVLLITDANSSVAALVQRTRANTIIKGQSSDRLKVRYLSRSEDVAFGDLVVTSGLGGIFPKGVVIGAIEKVSKEDFGIYQDAQILPAVDLDQIEEVALVHVKATTAQTLLPEPE